MRRSLSVLAAVLTFAATPAAAGIADSPLPVIDPPNGKTIHLYSVPGVINNNGLATHFSCTSTASAPIVVGIEVFSPLGGPPNNNAFATALTLNPGVTVTFATGVGATISVNANLAAGIISKGSARILSTSKSLVCTAFVADIGNNPPATSWQLTIIAKTKQKAAN